MINITNQKDVRLIRDMSFCYLCGSDLIINDQKNYDHVPPKSVFATEDRNFPIKLSIHKFKCHSLLNIDDEVIGQLISILHGKGISEGNDRINLKGYILNNERVAVAFDKLKIELLLQRWLRGFYATLYREALHVDTKFMIQPPLPIGVIENKMLNAPKPPEVFSQCMNTIHRNFQDNCDKIICNNGKLSFCCVWDKLNNDSWACIFHLNLYDWSNLGDAKNFGVRECTGLFARPDGYKPINAAEAIQ